MVISLDPPNLWSLILVSGILGLLVGMFGSALIGMVLFGEEGDRSYYFVIFVVLFVLSSGSIFGISRLRNQGSRTIFDWDTHRLDAHREFSFSWQGSLHDIQSLIVRCVPDNGRARRYRAAIELDVVGKHSIAARTARSRKKLEAARKEAMSLAEPLAAALGVSVHFEGWDETN